MPDSPVNIYTVVGARPQFVKAAVVSRALRDAGIDETLVHTGQHYDEEMSAVFFEELDIPYPDVNLEVGSGTHAQQTGRMMMRLETFLLDRQPPPDGLLVYGDTNSTLAAALVAAKGNIPLIHVEAGLRSFNRMMPEEINRILTDRVSQLLCCPTQTAVKQLAGEGITEGVFYTGDVMRDATLFYADRSAEQAPLEGVTDALPGEYYLSTIHRAENTDHPERLENILEAYGMLDKPVVLPLHPRTRERMDSHPVPPNVQLREPVGYLTMLTLIQNAQAVLTDSGGVQKEACWLETPCVTLREETEWVETLDGGWNQVVGADPEAIISAVGRRPSGDRSPSFGAPPEGGLASVCIVNVILEHYNQQSFSK